MGFFDKLWHRWLRRPYRLDYIEAGQGRQTVVLLHGLAASKEIWRDLIVELPPERWRILAPDLLGFGASPKPQWSTYTVREHARTVLAFIRRKHVRGPIIFVGHSMGCLIAAHIAARNPKLVKRLILYEPPLLGDSPDFPGYTKRSARYKVLFEYIASHPQLAHLENKMLWRAARKISGLYLSPEEWLPFEQSLRNTILNQQTYEELQNVTMPTDIIHGRLDMVVIRQGMREMFRPNKNIRLHVVTDTHGISTNSARYLARLLHTTKAKRRGAQKTTT